MDDTVRQPLRASLQVSVAVAGSHPAIARGEQIAVRLWNIVAGLAMLGGVAYAFFGGWYWAPIGIAAGLAVAEANRRSAAQVILMTAARNPGFQKEMLSKGVLLRG